MVEIDEYDFELYKKKKNKSCMNFDTLNAK